MTSLKSLLEALKSSAYTLLGVLLPGAILLEVAKRLFSLSWVDGDAVRYSAAAYIGGIAAEGLASLVFKGRFLKSLGESSSAAEAEALARRFIPKQLGADISRAGVLNICLSRVDAHRDAYDKFVALRDMSRTLALVTVLAGAAYVARNAGPEQAGSIGAVLLAGAIVTVAFLERYHRYARLPEEVVYAQFVVAELKWSETKSDPTPGKATTNPEAAKDEAAAAGGASVVASQ